MEDKRRNACVPMVRRAPVLFLRVSAEEELAASVEMIYERESSTTRVLERVKIILLREITSLPSS